MRGFHELTVTEVRRETPDAVSLAFEAAPEGDWAFRPGQYLTLRRRLADGGEVRRSYSICSAPGEPLRVGIKRVEDGRFSGWACEAVRAGDRIEVMPPDGRFGVAPGGAHDYLLIGAGSGITPLIAIASAVLEGEPESTVTLVYGNRDSGSIMFHEALEDLRDRHLTRFRLIHVLSREAQDVDLLHGRIDGERLRAMAASGLIELDRCDGVFLCGPGEMIDSAAEALAELGVSADRIHFERFTPAADAAPATPASDRAKAAAEAGAQISTILDGATRSFALKDGTVLEAAHAAGLELPFSCAGGMCCTCRCKVVEGEAEMAVNYSLEPWEVEAGYVLACQARPTTKTLVLDFDQV